MFKTSVRVVAIFLMCGCVFLTAAQPPASAQAAMTPTVVTYYACVDNSSGAIRIVS